jgi:hypothetical protein
LNGGNTKLNIHGSTAMRKIKRRESRRDGGKGTVWDTYRFGQEKSIWRKEEMNE